MVEFTETVRQRCRKCKGKLSQPTSNDREGFCCRGCYQQFYWKRCRACERPIDPKGGRIVCNRSSCKSAWRQKAGFGRFLTAKASTVAHASCRVKPITEVPAAQGLSKPPKRGMPLINPSLFMPGLGYPLNALDLELRKAVMAEFPSVPKGTVRPGDDRNLTGMSWDDYATWGGCYLTEDASEPAPDAARAADPARIAALLESTGPDGLDIPEFLSRATSAIASPPLQFQAEAATELAMSE